MQELQEQILRFEAVLCVRTFSTFAFENSALAATCGINHRAAFEREDPQLFVSHASHSAPETAPMGTDLQEARVFQGTTIAMLRAISAPPKSETTF